MKVVGVADTKVVGCGDGRGGNGDVGYVEKPTNMNGRRLAVQRAFLAVKKLIMRAFMCGADDEGGRRGEGAEIVPVTG